MRITPLLALALSTLTSSFAAESSAGIALLPNGSFDTDSKSVGWPDGWGNGPTPGITWEAEGGKHFMRLHQQEAGKMLMLYREVPLPAGTKAIEIAFKYRTS